MISKELYNDAERRWVFFGRDNTKPATLIDTNEYLVTHDGKGLLLDPGGMEIFPQVVSSITRQIDVENIEAIFASHQDPDIASSLALWFALCKSVKVYVPGIWSLFMPHFGGGRKLDPIPDEGMTLPLGTSDDLQLIPAHYVHSSGCFSLYDPVARILFTGDIGAALLPDDNTDIFVKNFGRHVKYMEGFHKRWMPSNDAKNAWVARVRELDIELMCPQHGSIFKKDDAQRFLDWFEKLEVGSAMKHRAKK